MEAPAGAVHHSEPCETSAPPQLAVVTEHHGRRSVLRLLGELDVCSADQLRRAVGTVLEQCDPLSVTVDLSALTFADCAGLSVLVWARNQLAGRGHELVITGCQPIVRRLLTLTGLDTYLRLGAPGDQGGRPGPAASPGAGNDGGWPHASRSGP